MWSWWDFICACCTFHSRKGRKKISVQEIEFIYFLFSWHFRFSWYKEVKCFLFFCRVQGFLKCSGNHCIASIRNIYCSLLMVFILAVCMRVSWHLEIWWIPDFLECCFHSVFKDLEVLYRTYIFWHKCWVFDLMKKIYQTKNIFLQKKKKKE